MFKLLEQYKKLFLLGILSNFGLEGPRDISEAEAKLTEAKEITKTTQESLLDFKAAMEYFSEDGVTLDKSVQNTNPEVSKDIQELLTLISIKVGNDEMNPGRADGWFGDGTEA
ncbi:hypothetical protein LAT59_03270, partial [Candidatus Gracilibacteria bacterium]|nr:hypothetical protein [Candidatus Gracilibacteria bacterium]